MISVSDRRSYRPQAESEKKLRRARDSQRNDESPAHRTSEVVPSGSSTAGSHDQKTCVLIVTDLALYRNELVRTLARDEIEAGATATTADETLSIVGELRPDVVLIDAGLPDGVPTVRAIVERFPDTNVVVIALPPSESAIIAYADAGASGFVTREGSPDDLLAAVGSAARGEILYPPEVAATWRKVAVPAAGGVSGEREPRLTPRELQIMDLVDRGLSNKEIAQHLGIVVATVKNHIHSVLEKLGAQSRGEAAAKVRKRQLPDQVLIRPR